jgi:hypothetical protein
LEIRSSGKIMHAFPFGGRCLRLFLATRRECERRTTGLNRLFGLPMHEFTDYDFEAESVLGPVMTGLHQRLGECRSAIPILFCAAAFPLSAAIRQQRRASA